MCFCYKQTKEVDEFIFNAYDAEICLQRSANGHTAILGGIKMHVFTSHRARRTEIVVI